MNLTWPLHSNLHVFLSLKSPWLLCVSKVQKQEPPLHDLPPTAYPSMSTTALPQIAKLPQSCNVQDLYTVNGVRMDFGAPTPVGSIVN